MVKIGIDGVDISRFNNWKALSKEKLKRVLNDEEISYCISEETLAAERFAAHFAAKEAFYKALSSLLSSDIPLLFACKHVGIHHKKNGVPFLEVNWKAFSLDPRPIEVSLTHTTTTAIAMVVIEDI